MLVTRLNVIAGARSTKAFGRSLRCVCSFHTTSRIPAMVRTNVPRRKVIGSTSPQNGWFNKIDREIGDQRIFDRVHARQRRVAEVALDEQPRRMIGKVDRKRDIADQQATEADQRQQNVGDRDEAAPSQVIRAGPLTRQRFVSRRSRRRPGRSIGEIGPARDSPASTFLAPHGRPSPHRRGRPPRT